MLTELTLTENGDIDYYLCIKFLPKVDVKSEAQEEFQHGQGQPLVGIGDGGVNRGHAGQPRDQVDAVQAGDQVNRETRA